MANPGSALFSISRHVISALQLHPSSNSKSFRLESRNTGRNVETTLQLIIISPIECAPKHKSPSKIHRDQARSRRQRGDDSVSVFRNAVNSQIEVSSSPSRFESVIRTLPNITGRNTGKRSYSSVVSAGASRTSPDARRNCKPRRASAQRPLLRPDGTPFPPQISISTPPPSRSSLECDGKDTVSPSLAASGASQSPPSSPVMLPDYNISISAPLPPSHSPVDCDGKDTVSVSSGDSGASQSPPSSALVLSARQAEPLSSAVPPLVVESTQDYRFLQSAPVLRELSFEEARWQSSALKRLITIPQRADADWVWLSLSGRFSVSAPALPVDHLVHLLTRLQSLVEDGSIINDHTARRRCDGCCAFMARFHPAPRVSLNSIREILNRL